MSDMLGQLASGLRRLATIKKDMDDLQFKEIILEQKSLLLDAKEEILSLREELSNLGQSIKEVSEMRSKEKDLVEIEGFKYDYVDEKPVGLPYCPKCEVAESRLYRLKRQNDQYSKCPNCENSFNAVADGNVHDKVPAIRPPKRRGSWTP